MGATDLSLCLIVKDEARRVARCLDSVAALGTEIIVVDTGSTDETSAVASQHGASVSSFDFARVDFAAARNRALSLAHGRWILVLDADEVLTPASVPVVRELVAREENAGYYFERVNHHPEPEPATTDYVVRLFPNRPDYRFRGRVHETIDAAILQGGGRLLQSQIRIDHEFASDAESRRRRNLRYIAILNEEIEADPADYSRLTFLAAEYHQLGMFEEAAGVAERIARVKPLDPEAHLHAAVYHLLYKIDLRQARVDLTEALRLRPGYPEALSFVGMLQEKEAVATSPRPDGRPGPA